MAALVALSMIVGNSVVELFTRFCGKRMTLLLWAAGVLAAATVGVALLAALPFLFLLRRLGEGADLIVDRRAGRRGPCAAQGLPEVAAVDATPRQPA